MIVCAHSPGYLPSVSVLAKVARCDAVVWLDDVRFTTPGWVNRNRLPDGTWLTVPVTRESHRTKVRDVRIDGDDWTSTHARALEERYRDQAGRFDQVLVDRIESPGEWDGRPLVELNLQVIARMLELAGLVVRQERQSSFAHGGSSLSAKTARMVREIGGTTYLSGPGGRRLLDPGVFDREGVELGFFEYSGLNPSAVDPLFRAGRLPSPAAETHREAVVPA